MEIKLALLNPCFIKISTDVMKTAERNGGINVTQQKCDPMVEISDSQPGVLLRRPGKCGKILV